MLEYTKKLFVAVYVKLFSDQIRVRKKNKEVYAQVVNSKGFATNKKAECRI